MLGEDDDGSHHHQVAGFHVGAAKWDANRFGPKIVKTAAGATAVAGPIARLSAYHLT